MAEHAHFDLVAVLAVEGKEAVATVALVNVHYGAARGHFGAVDREVSDLINGAVFAGLLLGSTCQQRTAAAGFDADGIGAGGLGRYGVGECVGAGAAGVALGGGDGVFGYVARGGHVGAETGVAIVRGGTGHHQSQPVAAAGQLGHGDGGAGVVFGGEGDGGRLSGDAVVHLSDGDDDARVGEGLGGNGVRALDGSVELEFALGNVALGALAVVHLGQVDVVQAGGEVDVVVASSASGAAGVGEPVIGLRSTGNLDIFVAKRAAPGSEGRNHGRPVGYHIVETDDLVGLTGDHAGKLAAHVDFVDEHLHIHRVAGIGIDRLRLVAHDAEIHADARAAVEGERIVALIAACGTDHVAGVGGGAAGRNPGQRVGGVIG